MDGISRETFEAMDDISRQNVLFDYAVETKKMLELLNVKIESLNRKAMKWGSVGGMLTAVGGYLAALFIGHITK